MNEWTEMVQKSLAAVLPLLMMNLISDLIVQLLGMSKCLFSLLNLLIVHFGLSTKGLWSGERVGKEQGRDRKSKGERER